MSVSVKTLQKGTKLLDFLTISWLTNDSFGGRIWATGIHGFLEEPSFLTFGHSESFSQKGCKLKHNGLELNYDDHNFFEW